MTSRNTPQPAQYVRMHFGGPYRPNGRAKEEPEGQQPRHLEIHVPGVGW
jgi:hypothetical protein